MQKEWIRAASTFIWWFVYLSTHDMSVNAASVAPGICGSFTKSQRLIFLSCFHDRNVLFLLLLCGAHSHLFVPLISLIIRKQTVAYHILTDPLTGASWALYKTVFISSFMAACSSGFLLSQWWVFILNMASWHMWSLWAKGLGLSLLYLFCFKPFFLLLALFDVTIWFTKGSQSEESSPKVCLIVKGAEAAFWDSRAELSGCTEAKK